MYQSVDSWFSHTPCLFSNILYTQAEPTASMRRTKQQNAMVTASVMFMQKPERVETKTVSHSEAAHTLLHKSLGSPVTSTSLNELHICFEIK